MKNATNAQRELLTRAGKKKLVEKRLSEGHGKWRALRTKIRDSPMPEGIIKATETRKELTLAILEGKDTSAHCAREIELSELEGEVEEKRESAIVRIEAEMQTLEEAQNNLPKGPGSLGAYGGVWGFMGGSALGMILVAVKSSIGWVDSTTFITIVSSTIGCGTVLGGLCGVLLGAGNKNTAHTLAETDHEKEIGEVYRKMWINPLRELAKKGHEIVENCRDLLSK